MRDACMTHVVVAVRSRGFRSAAGITSMRGENGFRLLGRLLEQCPGVLKTLRAIRTPDARIGCSVIGRGKAGTGFAIHVICIV